MIRHVSIEAGEFLSDLRCGVLVVQVESMASRRRVLIVFQVVSIPS